ncbi:amino acid adenylation domain-containing protein [Ktedonosporobacter rubrisoli]|uniref:Amino acid adenylation domain-containing protein n=1 Tax=Ktedonosporobacter rubrisoli TaxID=2509675 RepID=A0A4P6K3Z9_KTERU|nr:non-ribosomal peptide synthetase [Ktedonosporobacter rubrisoli]QBD82929.1 amino acid adenylation domain-containing protein [Ktedonosporobacter rubrisoli]
MVEEQIEDMYELSPMQRGMLFHTLYTPNTGIYIEQALYSLRGDLNEALLQRAWQSILRRHAVLRTAFVWEGLDEPIQAVYQKVLLPWQIVDRSNLSSAELERSLEELLATDRSRGFDVGQAPLLRIVLIRLSRRESYMLFTYHHLLLDGWSLAAILHEVLGTYEAYTQGQEPVLIARRPYRDYLAWLREQDITAAETFWKTYLQGFTIPTPLMIERQSESRQRGPVAPRLLTDDTEPDVISSRQRLHLSGGRPVTLQGFVLSEGKTEALRRFARQHHLTVNTLIQGAWSLLLSRYSGNTDVVFGATVTGRPVTLPGAENMIGLFINALPVRVQIVENLSLIPWLADIQVQQVEMRQYEYSPLVQIQGWSDVPRDQPLFESLVVFENYPLKASEAQEAPDELEVRALQMLEQTNYPLVVVVGPWKALEIHLGYEIDSFSAAAIARMLGHLRLLLEAFLTHPEQQLAEYSLLTREEQQRVLLEWNRTSVDLPAYDSWPYLFHEQVRRTPQALALSCGAQQFSYEELERQANRIAHYLHRKGVGLETRVALCMDHSPELFIGLLGILKAGAAYIPLDPAYPQARLALLSNDAQFSVVLTREKFRPLFAGCAAQIVCLDTERDSILCEPAEPVASFIRADNAAYMIYTSGSTGTPKGVICTHRALLNHSLACARSYKLRANDRVLQFASLSFDVLLEECLPSWSMGAAVIVRPEAFPPTPADFSTFIKDQRLSVLNIPSSYWHEWVADLVRTQTELPATLRAVIVGSERVLPAYVNNWRRLVGERVLLYNAYGLTETTVTALLSYASQDLLNGQVVPVGHPIDNVEAYILDERMQPVAIGLVGELYIGGVALARGYFQRSDLTAERFVPHPFKAQPGARLYRTGDRARYLASGEIEILGRLDMQVKLRGFRIEPAEIEAAMIQYPGVRECVVTVREDKGTPQLIAYIVAQEQDPRFKARLQVYAQEKLPAYMVPAAFVILSSLPYTPSGKINIRGLPAPEREKTQELEAYNVPRTPLEEVLASIWMAVLHLESVGRNDHFFRLGGHSLQATQVVARLREILQLELPVRAIYEAPSIARLAIRIEQLRKQGKEVAVPPLRHMERQAALPLSFAQERLWFLDQLQPDAPIYTISLALNLNGSLDRLALERALNRLIERHEPLRTVITAHDGVPVQHIVAHLELELPYADLAREASPLERESMAYRLIQEEVRRPFNLEQGPLVRARLFCPGKDKHIFLFMLHHIIADGWSIDILLQDLSALYSAEKEQTLAKLPAQDFQYADYVLWQREWLAGERLAEQQAYWSQQLLGAPPTLDLPTDRPRPTIQTYRGSVLSFAFTPSLSLGVREISQEEGVTPFMVLLAALHVLFARYTGSYDMVIGTPTAGRVRQETEQMVGLFLNTLPLRIRSSSELSFRALLGLVREVAIDAYMHQDIPFEKLVEVLQPERSQSHSPIFQVLFVFQNTPQKNAHWPDLQTQIVEIGSHTARFDLTIEMRETEQGIQGAIEYNTDLFERSSIARLVSHLQMLLGEAVTHPDLWLIDLPLLTDAERNRVLVAWNETHVEHTSVHCLHKLVEAQAARTPDAIAVSFEQMQLSYQQLNARANQLAGLLRTKGVGAEVPVGICLPRSLDLIVGILAVLKAGGAYVPLDPSYPMLRLADLLQDTNAPVILTSEEVSHVLPQGPSQTLFLAALYAQMASFSEEDPDWEVHPDQLAYIIYTSGSTGRPKGAMNTHRGICNRLLWMQQSHGLAPEDSVVQKTPLSFDVSLWEFFWPLCAGARLVIAIPEGHRDTDYLTKLVHEEAITTIHFVPSMLQAFLQEPRVVAQCQSIRQIICSGEALGPELRDRCLDLLGEHACLYNLYGPTETAVEVSVWQCTLARQEAIVPIGTPIDNIQLYVLDDYLQPVPVGVGGELYIGGVGVGRGYWRRGEMTAERFLPDPFSQQFGARLYRTGDRARWRGDGAIEYLGRVDEQVKLRGFRIELGEIENVLALHPLVQANCVIVREDTPGRQNLVAYVVPAAQDPSLTAELKDFLHARLPVYMVPALYEYIEALPLTQSGKLDRRALPKPKERAATGQDSVGTLSQIEELLTSIWSGMLQVEHISIHDNFFEIGGHSLLATRVISRIREIFRIEIPLRVLFEAPTIAELAQKIEEIRQEGTPDVGMSPVYRNQPRPAQIPLSFAQERLWFLSELEPKSPAYNIPFALRLRGQLRISALEASFNALVERHEILRTALKTQEGMPFQVISPEFTFNIPVITLEATTSEGQEHEIYALAMEEARSPFDFTRSTLVRVKLLRRNQYEHILLLTLHHCIADAWSIGILAQELSELYNATLEEREAQLPALALQYADYALWQREWLQGTVLEQQLAYWRSLLGDAPLVLELPLDYPRPALQVLEGAGCAINLSEALTGRLKSISVKEGVTLFMTLLAAFQVLLLRYTGQEDLIIGTPVAGRTRHDTEDLIGCFVNTLPLRVSLAGDPSFGALLARVRESCLESFRHQELPFERIVEAVQPARSMSHHPLFQVMFSLQNAPAGDLHLAGLNVEALTLSNPTTKFDLTLVLAEAPEGLNGILEYNTHLFARSTIENIARHFVSLLEEIALAVDKPVSSYALMTKEEQQSLLEEARGPDNQLAAECSLPRLISRQARRSPEAVAVVAGKQQLTYAELEQRSNQLARTLRRHGIRMESRVALCMERSLDLLPALLGVLKAGGVYVPLDPGLPEERLQFQVHDAQVEVLITQKHLSSRFAALQCSKLYIDEPEADWRTTSEEPLADLLRAEQLAYLIYTSGSTGQPKAVMVTHAGLANYLMSAAEMYCVAEGNGVPLHSSISFDLAVTSLFTPLLVGQRVILLAEKPSIEVLSEALAQQQNWSLLKLTPGHLIALANLLSREQLAASTGVLVVGGEALRSEQLVSWREAAPHIKLYNEYGPTETVVGCCVYGLPLNQLPQGAIPIGRPLANTQLYVLDRQGNLLPPGAIGELYIGGVGVARGYQNRADLTAERFVPDPYSGNPGARLYKTGDVVRRLPDGNLLYLGRNDQQVKIRGYRVELGEIESLLLRHPAIQEALVCTRANTADEHLLVAYCVPTAHKTVSSQEIQAYLRDYLPDYMLPATYISLEALPLTPGGKIDQQALPAPIFVENAQYEAPATYVEEVLATSWSQVLHRERIGRHDNFFALGGQSLLATQIISHVRKLLQVEIPLRLLFENPTIASLADAIVQLTFAETESAELQQMLAQLDELEAE